MSDISDNLITIGADNSLPLFDLCFAKKDGAAAALREIEALQLDPLNVVARSQDIALWGRVLDYSPEYLYQIAYEERDFFDYGASLFMYPMPELPYWSLHMRRRGEHGRWGPEFAHKYADLLGYLRDELRANGPFREIIAAGKTPRSRSTTCG